MSINLRKCNRVLIIMLFFVLFIFVQRMDNTYLLVIYFFIGELALYLYLSASKRISRKSIRLFIIMLFFWFQEFASAQEHQVLRYIVYGAEIILILYLLGYSFKHIKKINGRQFRITSIVLGALLLLNFIAILITYRKPVIFLYSAYDSCKYFSLIYYMLALRISKDEFKELLDLLAGVVIMHTICAVLQFLGNNLFFDVFRGKYKIVTRAGSFRSIGMFPYGIELGNFCCVLFALYYNFSKSIDKKIFYMILEICLVMCILVSGTRTAIANVFFVFIMSNIDNVKTWLRTVSVIVSVIIVGTNFINVEEIIARTKWDVSIELPRTYYMRKGIEIWADHPFFGIGYTTYASAKYRERTNDVIFDQYNAHAFDYANLATSDSFLVEIIPEYGIFGIVVILLYGRQIWLFFRKKKQNKTIHKGFVLVIASIFIMSFNTSSSLFSAHIGSWFWIACGMLLSHDPDEQFGVQKQVH